MLPWIIFILAAILCTALATAVFGGVLNGGSLKQAPVDSQKVSAANNALIREGNAEDVRFEVVYRGYRPTQVDEVIAQLNTEVLELREENSRLRAANKDYYGNGMHPSSETSDKEPEHTWQR